MFDRAPADPADPRLLRHGDLDLERLVQKLGGHSRFGNTIEAGGCVHRDHPTFGDQTFEAADRNHGTRRRLEQLSAVENHRVVVGEVVSVVVESDQVVVLDFSVGRVQVDNVQRPVGDTAVSEVMVETPNVAVSESISALKPRPSVFAIHEFI